jgi:hypothetical protein
MNKKYNIKYRVKICAIVYTGYLAAFIHTILHLRQITTVQQYAGIMAA